MGQVVGKIDVEQASFKPVKENEKYEIRLYEEAVAVETMYDCKDSNFVETSERKKAFQRLARYIGVFGNPENEKEEKKSEKISMTAPVLTSTSSKSEKISMTAPVVTSTSENENDDEKLGVMSFILPKEYTIRNAPKPKNPDVYLRPIPSHHVAAIRFSGNCDDKMAHEKLDELLNYLEEDQISLSESALEKKENGKQFWNLAQYNPPWTLPFARTNDILIPIKFSSN